MVPAKLTVYSSKIIYNYVFLISNQCCCCCHVLKRFARAHAHTSYPRCVCSLFHQALSQQTRHHLQLLLSLPHVGVQLEDFLEVAAGRQVVLQQRKKWIKKYMIIKQIQKSSCFSRTNFTAPSSLYEPGRVCRRLSCCSAPAAARSHSPVWPPQSDSASGGKWLWRGVAKRTKSQREPLVSFCPSGRYRSYG